MKDLHEEMNVIGEKKIYRMQGTDSHPEWKRIWNNTILKFKEMEINDSKPYK